jgi:hypothetical protein
MSSEGNGDLATLQAIDGQGISWFGNVVLAESGLGGWLTPFWPKD